MASAPALGAIQLGPSLTEVRFDWAPASGPVEGYYVFVSVNGSAETLDHATDTNRSLPIPGLPGDVVQVRVRAFDANDNVGPLSQVSEQVIFFMDPPPPPPPGDDPPPPDDPPVDPPVDPPPPDDPPVVDPPPDDDPLAGSLDGARAARAVRALQEDEMPSERSRIKVVLESTGVEPRAKGSLIFRLSQDDAAVRLRARGLAPDSEYELRVDDVMRHIVTTTPRGALRVLLAAKSVGDDYLAWDPRGKRVSLHDGTDEVLGAVISGDDEPLRTRVRERAIIEALDKDRGDGLVFTSFNVSPNGRKRFLLQTRRIPAGLYSILVDGEVVGELMTNPRGAGRALFGSRNQPLDFDPRGKLLQLELEGETLFEDEVEAQLAEFSECAPDSIAFMLGGTGSMSGLAVARLDVDEDCNQELLVEVANVPNGEYEVVVAGRRLGKIMTANGGGKVEFSSIPVEGEPPLPVDARDVPIEVEAAGKVVFRD